MSIGSFLQHMVIARQDVARSLEGALDDLPQLRRRESWTRPAQLRPPQYLAPPVHVTGAWRAEAGSLAITG